MRVIISKSSSSTKVLKSSKIKSNTFLTDITGLMIKEVSILVWGLVYIFLLKSSKNMMANELQKLP